MNAEGPRLSRQWLGVFLTVTPHGLPIGWIVAANVLVVLSLVLQHGFNLPAAVDLSLAWLDVLLAGCFLADLLLALPKGKSWRAVVDLRRADYWVAALFVVLLLTSWWLPPDALQGVLQLLHLRSRALLADHLLQLFLLFFVCVQLLRFLQRLFGQGIRPEWILAGSLGLLILVAAALLLLPNASADPANRISLVDAVFTATSAACVTGLVVRDTGADFSSFGQMILLATFQVGGLGIITFVALLSVFSTRTLRVPQMVAFRQLIQAPSMSELKRQLVGIALATAFIEVAGAALLWLSAPDQTEPLARLRWAVFHAVSAFCNAGFALQSDSLTAYAAQPFVMLTIMALVVLGGLGFLVIPELVSFRLTRLPLFRQFAWFRRLHAGQAPTRLSVQTKVSLAVTGALLLVGFVGFWALEGGHVLRGRPVGESFLVAAFQSVTPRTAGFNTVPIDQLQDATLVLLMMLMVVGASPVSTGGGIKTVTFGVLLLAIRAMVMRRERAEAFGRTLPTKVLLSALSVFVIYVLAAGLGVFLLAWFDPKMNLQDQVFEVISALSTVGLSTGITADLSAPSKLVLCALMFVGRVGPISLALSVLQSRSSTTYEFPEEEVVVG